MGYERFHMSISWCYPLVLMHRLEIICDLYQRTELKSEDELSIEFCGLFGLSPKCLPKEVEL